MKALRKLTFAMIIALAFASCGSEKQVINTQPVSKEQTPIQLSYPPAKPLPSPVPCEEASLSDGQYYRALGVGCSINQMNSRNIAFDNARQELSANISAIIQMISNCSLYDVSLTDLVKNIRPVYNVKTECMQMLINEEGLYLSYIAMAMSKVVLRDDIISQLDNMSKEQTLGIDFSEEKFVNYLNEIMEIK